MNNATVPVELAGIADDLQWLASRATPNGPIDTLLSIAARRIMDSAQAIVDGCCPVCGAGSRRYWRQEEVRRLAALRASYEEHLIEKKDVIPLMAHVRQEFAVRERHACA